jgi:hypothetical protein
VKAARLEEIGDAGQLPRGVVFHILIAEEEKFFSLLAHADPALNVVRPGAPTRIEIYGDEPWYEFFNGIIFGNVTPFNIVMIERDSYIPRIPDDVNDSGIVWLKAFMALQNARPG